MVAPVNDWGDAHQLRQDPPDVIFNTDLAPGDLAAFAKQFVQAPTPSLIYGQYGPSVEFLELAGDAANGWLWATVVGRLPDENGRSGRHERFEKKFGEEGGVEHTRDHLRLDLPVGAGRGARRRRLRRREGRPLDRRVAISWRVRHLLAHAEGPLRTRIRRDRRSLRRATRLYFQVQSGTQIIAFDPFVEAEFQLPPWMATT
ncbi:MAG: hypothetical protein U0S48_06910 [Solirubrobacteraceae bacterium]